MDEAIIDSVFHLPGGMGRRGGACDVSHPRIDSKDGVAGSIPAGARQQNLWSGRVVYPASCMVCRTRAAPPAPLCPVACGVAVQRRAVLGGGLWGMVWGFPVLELGVFEVEVVFDAAHGLVADLALVVEQGDLASLGLEELVEQLLVGE